MNTEDIPESVLLGVYIAAVLALVLLAIVLAADVVTSLRLSLTHPYSMSFTGGLLSYYIAHPFDLYQPADPVPHPTIYPPLFPLLVPAIPGVPAIIAGRAVNWLAIAASTGLLTYHGYRYSGRYAVAALVGGLFVLAPTITGPGVNLRVDHLALALTLVAITGYTREWPLWSLIALSIAAGFAKQPYAVVVIAAIGLAMYVRGDRFEAFQYATWSVIAGLVVLGALNLATDGWAVTHLVLYNAAVPWYTDVFLSQTYSFLVKHGLTVAIAIGVLAATDRDDWADPVPWLFVVGFAVALVTVGKEGSWIGYFYPAIAGGTVLVGRSVDRLDIDSSVTLKKQAAIVTVLVLLAFQLGMFTLIGTAPSKPVTSQQTVVSYLDGADGAVLSEDPSIVPDPQNPVDMFMVMGLVESGAVDGDPLAAVLRCGRYEHVVTWISVNPDAHEYRRWTEAQQRAIAQTFERVLTSGGYSVYRYNGTPTCPG